MKKLVKRRRTEWAKAERRVHGDVGVKFSKSKEYFVSDDGFSCTVTTFIVKENLIYEDMEKTKRPNGKGWVWDSEKGKWFRVRKLTPRECFFLMGVDKKNTNKLLDSGISQSQLYKMAGNSIVVDVMYYCFENLFYPKASDTLF